MSELKGTHVFAMFALGFGIIISVNIALALSAVRSFPGTEVKNSYVASQSFDRDRAAQRALGWEVTARLDGGQLILAIAKDGKALAPQIERAIFGRPTTTSADQTPEFSFDGQVLSAPVRAGPGMWNLRLEARAPDGTLFRQRIVVEARP